MSTMEERIDGYLSSCGLHRSEKHNCIATTEGKVVQWGFEPLVSLVRSVLELSDTVEELRNVRTTGRS